MWINFSPQIGHEQAGPRPALVLSPKSYNQPSGLMLACPITSKVKSYPFEVRIKQGKIDGVILADQVKNFDWVARPTKFYQKATDEATSLAQRLIESLVTG